MYDVWLRCVLDDVATLVITCHATSLLFPVLREKETPQLAGYFTREKGVCAWKKELCASNFDIVDEPYAILQIFLNVGIIVIIVHNQYTIGFLL